MASDEAVRSPDVLPDGSAEPAYQFLSAHQTAVLEAAIRPLVPGPAVGTAELDRPEANVIAYVDRLLSLIGAQTAARRVRVADLRDHYSNGIALLDQLAGGDFTAVPRLQQDLIVSHAQVVPFAGVLFDHIVEAIYAPPEMLRRNAADRYHETG